jgi:hypothetical protein
MLDNISENDIQTLLGREHCFENRYYRTFFGKLKVKKITHCVMCDSFSKEDLGSSYQTLI